MDASFTKLTKISLNTTNSHGLTDPISRMSKKKKKKNKRKGKKMRDLVKIEHTLESNST